MLPRRDPGCRPHLPIRWANCACVRPAASLASQAALPLTCPQDRGLDHRDTPHTRGGPTGSMLPPSSPPTPPTGPSPTAATPAPGATNVTEARADMGVSPAPGQRGGVPAAAAPPPRRGPLSTATTPSPARDQRTSSGFLTSPAGPPWPPGADPAARPATRPHAPAPDPTGVFPKKWRRSLCREFVDVSES